MTEPLSPAAQKVRHVAICAGPELEGRIAAALQAVADQVVPKQAEPPYGESEPWPQSYQLMADSKWEQKQQTRAELLAIAAELDGGND